MGRSFVDRQRRVDEVVYFVEDRPTTNVLYVGRTDRFDAAFSDSVWQIKRFEKVGNVTKILYANDGKYNAVWDSRATYFPAAGAGKALVQPVGLYDDDGDPYTLANPLPVTPVNTAISTGIVQALVLTNANTEYSHTFPANTKTFALRARTAALMKLAYTAGQSGATYWTIPAGSYWLREGLNAAAITIYLQSPTAAVDVELESWT